MSLIRVLVVDDSILMRTIISDMLNVPGEISVVGTAKNGMEAVEKVKELSPDVITMDVEMPGMDGISAVRAIMRQRPTPIIMVSAVTKEGAHATFSALAAGAVDFVTKPSGSISLDIERVKESLIKKIKTACKIDREKLSYSHATKGQKIKSERNRGVRASNVVVIGTSTGGPPALEKVLSSIPGNINAGILIVQHMPPGFTRSFAERLDRISDIDVKEAEDGDHVNNGLALIAPGNYHMEIVKEKAGIIRRETVRLNQGPSVHSVRPAADITMNSAADIYGSKVLGVVLTGMGCDGAFGLKNIKSRGGRTIACDEKTSVIFGMPRAAIELGCVDSVVPLDRIADEIMKML
ncbi:chemotaxis response regulator protein-glutamate methylesterase [Methanocella sp. CWC-04]|uniref:Protein-glutamate methylesterase/protein-glutamine glutaminase n=1 Tax=Methanooceanicella nereidis TaxID=2052831 RepID=A0AAP2RB66_9EURY|nr:chemotaxis response regulator protein-glutamate methylesterase [Methanocella sp. CWC-04]MCD1294168.1 chemotaxis response regulator protein-glutamate methylesterase [Methanocella sp. CWC-04]